MAIKKGIFNPYNNKLTSEIHVDSEGKQSYLRWLKIKDLCIVDQLQRSVKPKKVNDIAENMRELYLGTFTVAERKTDDGISYHVCEGQHRLNAIQKAITEGKLDEDIVITCLVYIDLSDKECRQICYACNRNRATIGANEAFGMNLANGDYRAEFIDSLLSSYGFESLKAPDVEGWNLIQGNNLINILRNVPEDDLDTDKKVVPYLKMSLHLLQKLWDKDKKRVSTNIVKGMYAFMHDYGQQIIKSGISEEELLAVFSDTTPEQILDIGRKIAMHRVSSNSDAGNNSDLTRNTRLAVLAAVMMAYKYDFDRFVPKSKSARKGTPSDETVILRIKGDSNSDENPFDRLEFVNSKKAIPKFERTKDHGYGCKLFA